MKSNDKGFGSKGSFSFLYWYKLKQIYNFLRRRKCQLAKKLRGTYSSPQGQEYKDESRTVPKRANELNQSIQSIHVTHRSIFPPWRFRYALCVRRENILTNCHTIQNKGTFRQHRTATEQQNKRQKGLKCNRQNTVIYWNESQRKTCKSEKYIITQAEIWPGYWVNIGLLLQRHVVQMLT